MRTIATDNGDTTYHQRFSVPFEYPVTFTHQLFSPDNPHLVQALTRSEAQRRHRVQVFVDDGFSRAWPGISSAVRSYLEQHAAVCELVQDIETVPGGEQSKNRRESAERVMASIAKNHLCRQSFVLAIGGGSALDIVGLAASLVHRGVRLIRVPTTVLAQCDSGVGVKNGIDAYGMKNYAGTFAPPFAVLNDLDLLETLEDRYWFGGIAEAFKVALIADPDLFNFLESHAAQLSQRDSACIASVVQRSAELHLRHIATSGDPFEFGTARPLDFGHWAAHRLEVMSDYALGHGECVGIGIALDTCYAAAAGCLTEQERDRIITAMRNCRLKLWSPLLERKDAGGELLILQGLAAFREHLGGQLTVTLPDTIGTRKEVFSMQTDLIRGAVTTLRDLSCPAGHEAGVVSS